METTREPATVDGRPYDPDFHWHLLPPDFVEWGRAPDGALIWTEITEPGIYAIDPINQTVTPWPGPISPEDRCPYCTKDEA